MYPWPIGHVVVAFAADCCVAGCCAGFFVVCLVVGLLATLGALLA